jgi:predicted nucleic acid-binding protein
VESFVLDASVAFSWCFPGDPTENTPYSRAILNHLERADAVVPEIWPFEIANSIFVAFAKRKRITEEQIHEYLDSLTSLPIRVEHRDIWISVSLESVARKCDLAAYDASYLDLAMRQDLPLATSDGPLKRAAAACGVKLVNV